MKPVINFITLFVADVQTSITFYKDGLGFPTNGMQEGGDHCLFELANHLSLVVYKRSEQLQNFTELSQTFIISHIAGTKDEVDAILQRALASGATQKGEVQNESWGYSGNFTDPDGYQWEIVYFLQGDTEARDVV